MPTELVGTTAAYWWTKMLSNMLLDCMSRPGPTEPEVSALDVPVVVDAPSLKLVVTAVP